MNTVPISYSLAQEIADLLRSYLGVADDDIQKSLIQKAIDDLKQSDPCGLLPTKSSRLSAWVPIITLTWACMAFASGPAKATASFNPPGPRYTCNSKFEKSNADVLSILFPIAGAVNAIALFVYAGRKRPLR